MVLADITLLTVPEAMAIMRVKTRKTVDAMVRRKEIPAPFHIGGRLRFHQKDIVNYVEAQTAQPDITSGRPA